jgi:hypothetical protein
VLYVGGVATLNWGTGEFYDNAGNISQHVYNRYLYNTSGLLFFDYELGVLSNLAGVAIDLPSSTLQNGTDITVDFYNGYLSFSGSNRVDWSQCLLLDTIGTTRQDWIQGLHYDSTGIESLDTEERQAYSSGGSAFVDWESDLTLKIMGQIMLGTIFETPQAKIHIDSGNAAASAIKFTAGTTTGKLSTDGFDLGIDGSGNAEIRQRENIPLNFYTNNTLRATLTAAGRLGIGISSPAQLLHVKGSGARIRIDATSGDPVLELSTATINSFLFTRSGSWHMRTDSTSRYVKLQVGDGAASQGLVQIGNGSAADPTPVAQLDVRANVNSSTQNILDLKSYAGTSQFAVRSDGLIALADSASIQAGTTTGLKIGTATSQKLGFWGATPIVQPTTAGAAATFVSNTSLIFNDTATFDGYTIGQVVKALRNAGILA